MFLNTTGVRNAAFGQAALELNVTGSRNTAMGDNAVANSDASFNTGVGANALRANQSGEANASIGYNSLRLTQSGENTAVGSSVFSNNVTGQQNTVIGSEAGYFTSDSIATLGTITGGSGYTNGTYTGVNLQSFTTPFIEFIPATIVVTSNAVSSVTLTGYKGGVTTSSILEINQDTAPAGLLAGGGFEVPVATVNTSGNSNVIIGRRAAQNATTSDRNTYIGTESGQNSAGTDNLFLGYQSGQNETGSNKLYIENSNSSSPLIYGEFNNNRVKINGQLELETKTPASASATGTVGEIAWDANYIYICTATNTWKRVAISTW
jgi:hypothetical protein